MSCPGLVVGSPAGLVADICDRVLVMQNGRLVEDGPVRQILGTPQHPYTQMLLSSMLEGKQPMTPLLGASPTTAPDAPLEVAR